MKQLESPTDWKEARELKTRDQAEYRPENIFKGDSVAEVTDIQGVSVVRVAAWPGDQSGAPKSFAVGDPVKAEDEEASNDRASQYEWSTIAGDNLPLEMEWQQSHASKWDFYFRLAEGAKCFGLGERLSSADLRGRVHTLFSHSDYVHIPSLDPMYMSIPFLIISHQERYYGVFLDSPARQRWCLDDALNGEAHIELLSRRGWTMYIFDRSSLPDLIAAYTALTGRSKLPPNWALGHFQSRWSYPDEGTVINVAEEFRARSIPCDVVVLDIDYMEEYRVFTHSEKRFPNFKATVDKLSEKDFKVVCIVDPGVKKDAKFSVYQDGMKRDFFCKKADGKTFYGKVWPGQCVFPDFLRHDVRVWWSALTGFYTENNVAGIWNDMNEPQIFGVDFPLPLDAIELPNERHQMFVQQAPEGQVGHFEVRNLYGMQMSRASWEGLMALDPDMRPFVLTRSAYAGVQRYAAVWLGDNMSWWEHLALSVPMLVNVGLSGVPFCGVDVGGFGDDCSPELLIRWYECGLFYPFFRNHCSKDGAMQEPWQFSKEVEDKIRHLIETRYRLLPYIRNLFWEHVRNGAPIIRPLFWDYPGDENVLEIDDEFLFGRDILVAPVVKRSQQKRPVYLPEGLWHPFEGGAPLVGGRHHVVDMPLGRVPAFVRDGAIIPFSPVMQSTQDYEYCPITFTCFGEQGIGLFTEDDGISFEYENDGYNEWLIQVSDGEFRSQLVNYGYIAPERKFFLEWNGRTREINLER